MSSMLPKSSSAHSNKAAPKVVNRLTRVAPKSDALADPSSPLKSPRLSVDRSQRSQLNTKRTSFDRRSPKASTPPDKQQTRVPRGSELQAQLSLVQEELKNAKEKLVLIEKEKTQAVEGLTNAQKSADEANEKLTEAQVAQKRAEENFEIEKFRAVETEQAAIESTQKKKEEWEKELEAVQNQHALDVTALLLATEELQRVKQELTTNLNVKNEAAVHAQKVEFLSAEVVRLKAVLDSKLDNEADDCTQLVSKLDLEKETWKQELEKSKEHQQKLVETEACVEQLNVELEAAKLAELYACKSMEEWQKKVKNLEAQAAESTQLVSELDLEIQTLKQELEKAKGYEQKLVEKEALIEKLKVELEAAELAKSYAHKLMKEWPKKVKELEARAKESSRLERSASESMESVMKQLEGNNDLLHDAKSEILSLKEKVGLLEISITRQRGDLDESERQLSIAKEKADEFTKKAKSLGYELENVEEEKNQALYNEKLAAESVQTLLEEKNKLINELQILREKEQRSKKAMESLATDLHEVSTQARETKERLLSSQTEHENYEDQIEHLRLVLNATNEKYKSMLDEVKHEIDILTDTIEQNKQEYQNSRNEWEQKEVVMMKSGDENSLLRKEISKLINLLREAEDEAGATKEEGAQLKISLKEAEIEEVYLKEIIGETKAESMRLKESLLDKETELQSLIEENNALLTRESAAIEKIEELKKLLDEALTQKKEVVNGEQSESEKDCYMSPKVVKCYEQNGHSIEEEKPKAELPIQQHEQVVEANLKLDNCNLSDEDLNVSPKADLSTQQHEQVVGENLKLGNCNLSDEDLNIDEVKNMDEKQQYYENKINKEETDEVNGKKWDIIEIGEKELPDDKERNQDCIGEDLDSKVDSLDQINGLSSTEMVDNSGTSPSKQPRKKKKPLLQKFGSLLKKKGTINQK